MNEPSPRIAAAFELRTLIGDVYVSPNGIAHRMDRIGERRGGVVVSTSEMSDAEIKKAGLTGKVQPARADANRLYGGAA